MTSREKALKWWRSFSELDQKYLAMRVFPDKSFIEVSTSSNLIERVWNKIVPAGNS